MANMTNTAQITQSLVNHDNCQINQVSLSEGIDTIEITHPRCKAIVSLYAGHVLSWQPTSEREVFWLSEATKYAQGSAIRGGIPLCWPWFGPKAGEVNHGFTRTSIWQLDSVSSNDNGVSLILTFSGESLAKTWPYRFKLTQTLFFGDVFKQTLKIDNLGEQAFEHSGALHSYFHVSQPEQACVPNLTNIPYYDKLTDSEKCTRLIDCRGPKDRVYKSNEALALLDYGFNRKLVISTTGSQDWVLWNPGQEVASSMSDIHPRGEQHFVCLEAGFTKPLTLAAGQSYEVSQEIAIQAI